MKNIAPNITRQRLLIEAFYQRKIDHEVIEAYFEGITKYLHLKAYGKPIIFLPEGFGKNENQGYDAFVPLIDSGISLYVWSNENFLSVVIYTCKDFDAKDAIHYTTEFFDIAAGQIEQMSF